MQPTQLIDISAGHVFETDHSNSHKEWDMHMPVQHWIIELSNHRVGTTAHQGSGCNPSSGTNTLKPHLFIKGL